LLGLFLLFASALACSFVFFELPQLRAYNVVLVEYFLAGSVFATQNGTVLVQQLLKLSDSLAEFNCICVIGGVEVIRTTKAFSSLCTNLSN